MEIGVNDVSLRVFWRVFQLSAAAKRKELRPKIGWNLGGEELDVITWSSVISIMGRVKKRRQVGRCLAQNCLEDKKKPAMEPPGVEGGPAHQFIEMETMSVEGCVSGKADGWMVKGVQFF